MSVPEVKQGESIEMKCPICRDNGKDVEMKYISAKYSDELQQWLMGYMLCSECGTIVK